VISHILKFRGGSKKSVSSAHAVLQSCYVSDARTFPGTTFTC